ncbi:hypothetical protein FKM82_020182 [Ascaphus truei]
MHTHTCLTAYTHLYTYLLHGIAYLHTCLCTCAGLNTPIVLCLYTFVQYFVLKPILHACIHVNALCSQTCACTCTHTCRLTFTLHLPLYYQRKRMHLYTGHSGLLMHTHWILLCTHAHTGETCKYRPCM